MSELRAAYRYARALLETAEAKKTVDRVSADLQVIEKLMKASREFLVFLRSPVINREKKEAVIAELLKERISTSTYEFLLLLASKSREMILPDVIRQFYHLRDERRGIDTATVRSAVPLTKEQEQQLVGRLEKITRKKIRLRTTVDTSLRGGLTVQIGDTLWDGSVAHQLSVLRERFIAAPR